MVRFFCCLLLLCVGCGPDPRQRSEFVEETVITRWEKPAFGFSYDVEFKLQNGRRYIGLLEDVNCTKQRIAVGDKIKVYSFPYFKDVYHARLAD